MEEGTITSYTGTTDGSRPDPRQTGMHGHITTTYASKMVISTDLSTFWHSFSLELVYNPNCGYRKLRHLLKLTSNVTFWMSSFPPWNHFMRNSAEIRILFRWYILINFEFSHSCHQTVRHLRAGTMCFFSFVFPLVIYCLARTVGTHRRHADSPVCQ